MRTMQNVVVTVSNLAETIQQVLHLGTKLWTMTVRSSRIEPFELLLRCEYRTISTISRTILN